MEQGRVTVLVHCTTLPKTCITGMESFEPMVTKLCYGLEMLNKIDQKRIIQKLNKVELQLLCTALQVIARNMHTKYGVIRTYDDKVMLQTIYSLKNQTKVNN